MRKENAEMKKILLVLFVGLLSLLSNGLKAQEVFQPYKTNAVPYHGYLFPVIPGTEEWMALGSYEARLESVQLPMDTLKDISTTRLLETCIYNPFMIDAFPGRGNPKRIVFRGFFAPIFSFFSFFS